MKRLFAVVVIVLNYACSTAQVNLVMNPSLEKYSTCPDNWDEIKYANYWMSLDSLWNPPDWAHDPAGVPDYCNVCSIHSCCALPGGGYFYHYAHTGNAMAQVQMFYNEWDITNPYKRDYLQGHLFSNLTLGQSYCVTFYVVQEGGSGYAVNNIAALLDDGTIDTTTFPGLIQNQFTPQILESSMISDTLNWTKIQGSFTATGSERLITIGNFTDTAHMSYILMPGLITAWGPGYSWYLVDDISVFRSDAAPNAGPDVVMPTSGDSVVIGDTADTYLPVYWYLNGVKIDSNKANITVHPDTTTTYVEALQKCGGEISYDTVTVWVATEGITSMNVKNFNPRIWPNPATDQITVENAAGTDLIIYDLVGKELYHNAVNFEKETCSLEKFPPGMYVAQVIDPLTGSRKTIKIIKE